MKRYKARIEVTGYIELTDFEASHWRDAESGMLDTVSSRQITGADEEGIAGKGAVLSFAFGEGSPRFVEEPEEQ